MKTTIFLTVLAMLGANVAVPLLAEDEIGFLETFALADDREEALKQLIPGTEDFYYFTALHRQNLGRLDDVDTMFEPWIKRYGRTDRMREIQNRQALLRYPDQPGQVLEYLQKEMGLQFNDRRQLLDEKPDLPSELNPGAISRSTLLNLAFANSGDLALVEDRALDWILRERVDLTEARRRDLLSRLRYPDHENLVPMIAADLRTRESRGFGEFFIHQRLLPEQLDALSGLRPDLLNNTEFVFAYVRKLHPGDDIDWQRDTETRGAYLERLWDFVEPLQPAFHSLKAHVLYQLLQHRRDQGEYPRDLFMAYIKLPRPVSYINPDYLQRPENQPNQVDLTRDFSDVTRFSAIGNDEALVRDYLMHYFETDDSYEAFAPFIRDTYLRPVFAETKIVNGIGNQEKWFSMLSPGDYQALKDRVDIDFAPENPREFAAGDAVELDVLIKNVPKLIVKVYEINALNFYLQHGREINSDLNLDGLVANEETVHEFGEPPLRRVRRSFAFDGLKDRRGTWIVEFIGNGRSSRAVLRKGRLQYLGRTSAAGEILTILDENNVPVQNPAVWMGGRKFTADEKKGRLAVPFSNQPGPRPIVLTDGEIASLESLVLQVEKYALSAGFHVDRENLLAGKETEVAVRPSLTVNGRPVTLSVLDDVKLIIRSTDLEGVVSVTEVPGFKLFADREPVHAFRVPARLGEIQFQLDATIQNLSQGRKENLSCAQTFALNEMDRTEYVANLFLSDFDGQYVLELLGKTGEGLADRPVHVTLKHRDFRQPVQTSLRTGEGGRVLLGVLEGIVSVAANGSDFKEAAWRLPEDRHSYPASIHGRVGEDLLVPFMGSGAGIAREDVALLETRGGSVVKDWFAAIELRDGFLRLRDLPAGDYELHLRNPEHTVMVRMTGGDEVDDFVLSRHRHLERQNAAPLQIGEIEVTPDRVRVRVENAGPFTRLHAVATRFLPDYRLYDDLGGFAYAEPLQIRRGTARTLYVSGRDIGEEYRYILERQYAQKFPGIMLERPALLLNPWALRSTETAVAEAAEGEDWSKSQADVAARMEALDTLEPHPGAPAAAEMPASFPSLAFLKDTAPLSFNLKPDKDGWVTFLRADLGDRQHLHVLAVDPENSVSRHLALPEPDAFAVRDTRLARNLDPDKHFTEQKKITILRKGEKFAIEDARSSDVEIYDDLVKVYSVFSALSGNATLAEFAFVTGWPDLSDQEKRERYSKFASHELNFFLARRDPDFYATVVQPYLRNKKDKTFLDFYLVESDLGRFLQPWEHGRLNVVERILLAQRIGGAETEATARHIRELFELITPDVEQENFQFLSALRGRGLAMGDDAGIDLVRLHEQEATKELALGAIMQLTDSFAAEPSAGGVPAAAPVPALAAKAAERDGREEGRAKRGGGARALGRQIAGKEIADEAEELALYRGLDELELRERQRAFYRQLEKTQEWAENNYYHLPISQQNAQLITANAFWRDYAAWDGKSPFFSKHFVEATRNFSEMMFALAVLELPFKAEPHESKIEEGRFTLTAASPAVLFHKEIQEAPVAAEKTPVLVSQNFFRHGDRYRQAGNEKVEKYVTDEFLTGVLYGCQVVVTNPTSATQKLDVLLQIPEQSIPALASDYTRSQFVQLEPYATQKLEYFFYFPAPSGKGTFAHYPVQVAKDEELIAWAEPFRFKVVDKLSRIDEAAWEYVSQFAEDREVLAYLEQNNVERLNLNLVAWRAREDDGFLRKVTGLLEDRHVYNNTLWSYGLYHQATPIAREFMLHADAFLAQCGDYIDCALVTIDPVARRSYEHLEYRPLVNARAHRLGKERKILNDVFRAQYLRLMKILGYRAEMDEEDRLAVASYLLLQDRIEEGLDWLDRVEAAELPNRLQYDYLSACAAMLLEDPSAARQIAQRHADYPVDRWRDRFAAVISQAREIAGEETEAVDPENREQAQDVLAATEPVFDFNVENRTVTLNYRNLEEVTLNYYLMDLEFLFSSNPFVTQDSGRFSYIRPTVTQVKRLPGDAVTVAFELPKQFHRSNVLLEIVGAGQKQARAYYANQLKIEMAENYGRLQVRQSESGKPLGKVYVKVYARYADGETKFYKDGYTDLRGKFDYTSLNTGEIEAAERFALLVMSEEHGAVVREAAPPQQ